MGRILVRFERVTTDVDTNVTCVRLDDNSENEQCSPEDSIDLSDLDNEVENFDSEKREKLEGIFNDDGDAKEKIRREVELAWGLVGEKDNSSP
ncbi:hypothetical protein JHK85_005012 [Glycine max]|nr:hypothetical protein JHK85_005012 [Glycine max]KAG5080782.1 hypothetical protein JHK86_004847 [Glycine max]